MPATEQTWRNQKLLHVVFGVTSLLMLLTTIWMFAADHTREWKGYQKTTLDVDQFYTVGRVQELKNTEFATKLNETRKELEAARTQPVSKADVDEFVALLKADAERREVKGAVGAKLLSLASQPPAELSDEKASADEMARRRSEIVGMMREELRQAKLREDNLLQTKKFKTADLTAELSLFDLAVGQGRSEKEIADRQAKVDELKAAVDKLQAEYDAAGTHRRKLEEILKRVTKNEDDAQKKMTDVQGDVDRFENSIEGFKRKAARTILGMPILDAFDNSDTRIDQIWLPELTINYNFSNVPRFDRCITCHRSIDKTQPGSATEPAYLAEQPPFDVNLATPTKEEAEALRTKINEGELNPAAPVTAAINAAADEEQGSKLSKDELFLREAYGLQLAEHGLIDDNDVMIQVVWPKSGETVARAAEAGLAMGDVITGINGASVVNRDDAVAQLTQSAPFGKPVELTIRRGLPHPFATHPRLDLFMGSLSPHKKGVMGCTICHDGQGSATAFKWASHTPNTPEIADRWRRDHEWFDNHHWIFPMYPERFIESGCLKCHHEVVELEPSPRFPEPPAPKLMAGYHLVREYGCFGCHEINGYDGPTRRIGPDMRAEPNFSAAGQALLYEEGLSDEERGWAAELVQRPDADAARRLLFERIELDKQLAALQAKSGPTPAEKQAEAAAVTAEDEAAGGAPAMPKPRLSANAHKLGDLLKDVESPGRFRKVGPSLRHVASKTDFTFLYDWIRKPSDFRPSTRMPQFFGLWQHLSPDEQQTTAPFESIEIRALSEYLLKSSKPFEFLPPPEGITAEASVARGQHLFQTRGCLACHSSAEFPGIEQNQGPDLTRIASKFGSEQGKQWLYSWIRQPNKYHARTKMPDVFLQPITDAAGKVSDPAADVVAYLLTTGPGIDLNVERTAAETPAAEGEGEEGEGEKQPAEKADAPAETSRVTIRGTLAGSPAAADSRLKPGMQVVSIAQGDSGEAVSLSDKTADEIIGLLRGKPGELVRLVVLPAPAEGESESANAEPITIDVRRPEYVFENIPGRELTDAEKKSLQELSLEHLAKVYPRTTAERYLQDGITDLAFERIKGDDAVLFGPTTDSNRVEKQIQYVGRRAISKYGCFGCHDVPGFEDAKPIGTGLADWGRKDPSRLAFEQITSFLPMHGHGAGHGDEHEELGDTHGSAGHDNHAHTQHALPGHGLSEDDIRSQDTQFFLHAIGHHNRQGFLWQKLRQPRSYDYKKVDNKSYNDRLRMPQFPFNAEEREQVMTFILALVSEPPSAKFIYKPNPQQEAIVKGRRVLEEFNCGGCHTLQMERWDFKFAPDNPNFGEPSQTQGFPFVMPHLPQQTLAESLKTDRRGQRRAIVQGRPAANEATGKPLMFNEDEDPIESAEDLAAAKEVYYSLEIWDTAAINGYVHQTGMPNLLVNKANAKTQPMWGGHLANYLFPHVIADEKQRNPAVKGGEAWGWLPPPLVGEGAKVQTNWLYDFLLDPFPIRPAVVLRMPKFNLSANDATAIANYFAAVENAAYPYEYDTRTSAERLATLETAHPNRLQDALNIVVNNTYCVKCHLVGDFRPGGSEKAMGPNLDAVYSRLRPEFAQRWIADPRRILPYTGMPVNIPFKPEPPHFGGVAQSIFAGTSFAQLDALVDFLMNYDTFTRQKMSIKPLVKEPPPEEKKPEGEAGEEPPAESEKPKE